MVAPDLDTIFLSTSLEYACLSSSMVREYASYGVSVKEFVPANVLPKIEEKMRIVKTTRGGI
jgi:pantetheine-phosphate adenylyltransferase